MNNTKFDIDYVFPYVNPTDKDWQEKYSYFSSSSESANQSARFRDFSLLKFIFRSIEIYAPFIKNVFILVATENQIPSWVNKGCSKLKIITHDQFIPEKYLPTFNSNTIETFTPFIPGLSEHFIYGNDDIIFRRKTEASDFFYSDQIIKFAYTYRQTKFPRDFQFVCQKTWQIVNELFPKVKIDNKDYTYIKQFHGSASPRLLSDCKECYNKLESKLLKNLTQFRSNSRNVNQYIYGYISIFLGHVLKIENEIIGNYLSIDDLKVDKLIKELNNTKSKMICINDTASMTQNDIDQIYKALNILFPNKSSFEN